MNRRILFITVAVVVVAGALYWALRPSVGPRRGRIAEELPTPTPAPEERVMLLFLGGDGLLHPELRTVALPAETEERVRTVVRELLAGPSGKLLPVAPYQAELLDVFVDGNGHAFVDLSAPPEPLTGSNTELVLAYGVVDSVLLNCPRLAGVQLLFDGTEVSTLSGHLDLSRPLGLNKRFIGAS